MPEAERMSDKDLDMYVLDHWGERIGIDPQGRVLTEAIRARASESRLTAKLAEERGKRERLRADAQAIVDRWHPPKGVSHNQLQPLGDLVELLRLTLATTQKKPS